MAVEGPGFVELAEVPYDSTPSPTRVHIDFVYGQHDELGPAAVDVRAPGGLVTYASNVSVRDAFEVDRSVALDTAIEVYATGTSVLVGRWALTEDQLAEHLIVGAPGVVSVPGSARGEAARAEAEHVLRARHERRGGSRSTSPRRPRPRARA